jgi:hypothetical protein
MKIGNYPDDFNNLEDISFFQTLIDFIPTNALNFRNYSNEKIVLDFRETNMNELSFEFGALTILRRPADLSLLNSKFVYLDKKIFKPFLDYNAENRILLTGELFDCNFRRSNWLANNAKYSDRSNFKIFSNGKNYTDIINFADCA